MNSKGLIFNEGQIIDAGFVLAPKQHNSREENKKIKNGNEGDLWDGQPDKKIHKDMDARWTQKGGQNYFGYKNHIKADLKSKFIKKCYVSDASVHDSQALKYLLDESDEGQSWYADSAYVGQDSVLEQRNIIDEICEKGYRNRPLTEQQKEANRKKSTFRCRVEHVFGFEEGSMHRLTTRTIGLLRAKSNIFLTNLIYNFYRFEQILRRGIS
jgi:IS5 family transposase